MGGSVGNSARKGEWAESDNRSVRGVRAEVVPRVQSKLSLALHAHRGKKLLQDPQILDSSTRKRATIRSRGAREKPGGFARREEKRKEETMEGPLPAEGDLRSLGWSRGLHDTAGLFDSWWDVSW